MSAEAMGWAWRHSPYTGAALLVHLAIADVVNDMHDNEFWASMSTLAAKARVERRTAGRAVAQMVSDGLLVVITDHREDRTGQPSKYRMVTRERVYDGGGSTGPTPQTGDGSTRPTGVGRQNPGGGSTEPTNAREPKGPKTSSPSAAQPYEQEFAVAWEQYPRRDGRLAALKAYQARRRAGISAADLLAATVAYAASVKREGREKRHIMLGSTFYGPNERWLDYGPGGTALTAPDRQAAAGTPGWMARRPKAPA